MSDPNKARATERARLHHQGIDACNQIVMSPLLTQDDIEDTLARIAAFAQTRLEQCIADPKDARVRVEQATLSVPDSLDPLDEEEPDDDDLSFLQ